MQVGDPEVGLDVVEDRRTGTRPSRHEAEVDGVLDALDRVDEPLDERVGIRQGPRREPGEDDDGRRRRQRGREVRRGPRHVEDDRMDRPRERGEAVLDRRCRDVGWARPAGREDVAAVLVGQRPRQRPDGNRAAQLREVRPAPSDEVLDPGRDVETSRPEVEVDDDARRPRGRPPTGDGDGERARSPRPPEAPTTARTRPVAPGADGREGRESVGVMTRGSRPREARTRGST